MKKSVCIAVVLVISLFSLPLFAVAADASVYYDASLPRVIDDAELLSSSEETELAAHIAKLTDAYGVDIVILTNDSLDGKTPEAYADDFYDYNGYGVGDTRDGMLFLISMNTRDYWTSTTGECIQLFSDYDIESLGDLIVDDLSYGNYYKAFSDYVDAIEDKLVAEYASAPVKFVSSLKHAADSLVGILIASLIITAIVVTVMRKNMKPVALQSYAGEYIDKDSFILTEQSDTYLFTTTTRKRVPRESSSSSGGGGSSTHTGSSGTSHGGGGGKF